MSSLILTGPASMAFQRHYLKM